MKVFQYKEKVVKKVISEMNEVELLDELGRVENLIDAYTKLDEDADRELDGAIKAEKETKRIFHITWSSEDYDKWTKASDAYHDADNHWEYVQGRKKNLKEREEKLGWAYGMMERKVEAQRGEL